MRLIYFIIGLVLLFVSGQGLDYTYNATTGIYNVTAGDSYLKSIGPYSYSKIIESRYYEYDATNESYITLLALGDILEDQKNFYKEKRYNSDYVGKYDESLYFTENEAYDFIRQCDALIVLGNNLLNETSILFEQNDYNGTVECYYRFLKLRTVTPSILEYGTTAAYVLSDIHSNMGTYNAGVDRGMEQDRDGIARYFEFDDTKARQQAESAASILAEKERKKRYQSYFNDTGIKITTGDYESSKLVTVPLNNCEISFQIRTIYEMEIIPCINVVSKTVGTGKYYHTENFTMDLFVMGHDHDLIITIADYIGPAKYKPTNPFDSLSLVDRRGYKVFDYGSIFRIDGHTGRKYESFNSERPNKPHMCVVSYALDSNTFVQVHTQHLDQDKDVALLLETLHIEKKTN